MYVSFAHFIYLCINLLEVSDALGLFVLFIFILCACSLTIFTLNMLQRSIVGAKFYFCLAHVISLWLIHPDLVPMLPFTGLGLLLMVMFAVVLLVVMRSGLSSHALYPKLTVRFYWMGLTWLHSFPLSLCAPESAIYDLSIQSCSAGTVCIKCPLIIHFLSLSVLWGILSGIELESHCL